MNDAARQTMTDATSAQLFTGEHKVICTICRGYTSGDARQTYRNYYVFENRQDKDLFQVYFATKNEGIKPLTAKGYGNKEIAEKLHISVKTVEVHKANIVQKLNLTNRPELIEFALWRNLLHF